MARTKPHPATDRPARAVATPGMALVRFLVDDKPRLRHQVLLVRQAEAEKLVRNGVAVVIAEGTE